jgi:hypothetical protein
MKLIDNELLKVGCVLVAARDDNDDEGRSHFFRAVRWTAERRRQGGDEQRWAREHPRSYRRAASPAPPSCRVIVLALHGVKAGHNRAWGLCARPALMSPAEEHRMDSVIDGINCFFNV